MGIIEKLLGRRAKTATNLAAEIDTQFAAIDKANAKIAAARAARKTAIEEFDAEAHRTADADIAEAGRDIERRENAIEKLKLAQAEQVEAEAREFFRKEDAALAEASAALTARIKNEYPALAAGVAEIVRDLAVFQEKRAKMQTRGKALGLDSIVEDAEDFRGVSAKQWSAKWPAPEGGHVISGPVEDAPRGAVKWVDGEPVAVGEGVEVQFRGGGWRPDSLVESVGNLPKLPVGGGYFREAPEPPKPAHCGLHR